MEDRNQYIENIISDDHRPRTIGFDPDYWVPPPMFRKSMTSKLMIMIYKKRKTHQRAKKVTASSYEKLRRMETLLNVAMYPAPTGQVTKDWHSKIITTSLNSQVWMK